MTASETDRPPLELFSYLVVVAIGGMAFFSHAETTVTGIGVAGLKFLALVLVMGAVTMLGMRIRKRWQNAY